MGVMLRVLLAVNLLAALTVLTRVGDFNLAGLGSGWILMAGRVEPSLFAVLLVLAWLSPWFARQRLLPPDVLVVAVVTLVVLVLWPITHAEGDSLLLSLLWTVLVSALTVLYFDYRYRRCSPSIPEARLLSLTMRIRPHFLFNALNAVLGVIRSDPARAEDGLMSLADLLRVFMRDNRELTPLSDEIALSRAYVELEQLRLGDRLQLRWETDESLTGESRPEFLLVPPLLLQPLVENAVYYGIEPTVEGGEIVVRTAVRHGKLSLEVDNPISHSKPRHTGNKMAMDNIRERLMLYYDLEAELLARRGGGRYCVTVTIPLRRLAS